ncbi:MAG: asparagine synthase (glutamine-hydrolyzing) [Candidatus ainarchaeum sp.]|nr:asparagine synthase (glutamine-hydrolyzing) [Candidatus ainarchaeum sp.]
MCGINGITFRDEKIIKLMNNTLKHRGPDALEYRLFPKLSLGHARLSIIDLTSAGNQPMIKFGYTIVFNGEIYNYLELKEELIKKGYKFTTKTDTEVILAAYNLWGKNCLNKFNGMWAFAIYNDKEKELFLSRDRFGVKPLYYSTNNKNLAFSSEIKPLLKIGISRKPNEKIIASYLQYGLIDYNNETFFENIYTLEPGHYAIWNFTNKKLTIKQYYELKNNKIEISETNATTKIKEILEDSIKLRFRSDVEVGCCLSGGLDSSTIVGVSDKLFHNSKLKTFSAVFPGSKINEERYIDLVTKEKKVKNFKTKPKNTDLLKDIDDLIYCQEEPFGSTSIYAQYRVMKLVKETGVKVLLDGQGADELFIGYHSYFNSYIQQLLKDKKYAEIVTSTLFWKYLLFYLKSNPRKIFNKIIKYKKSKIYNLDYPKIEMPKYIDDYALLAMKTSLRSLLKWEDKDSMSFSIESRVPFLDYRLVESAFSLPYSYKIKNFQTKYIFRKAINEYIPEEIIDRKDKIGFATPENDWFKSKEFTDFIEKIIESKSFKDRKYWNYIEVRKMVDQKNKDYYRNIWKIINTELWLRTFIDPLTF